MEKTSIRELMAEHPELLDADTYILVTKNKDGVGMALAGTTIDLLTMLDGAVDTITGEFQCPGCPNCQDGQKH